MTAFTVARRKPRRDRSPSRPRVLAILPRGEAIRNFAYSGALDRLAESADVTALAVRPNVQIWSWLESRSFQAAELEQFPPDPLAARLRDLLDMTHGRRLWSKAAQDRWLRQDLEARSLGRKLARAAKKVLVKPLATERGVEWLARMERSVSLRGRTQPYYRRLLETVRPDLVFNGSHIHGKAAMDAVLAAQRLGIPTAAFLFSWDNLTSQGRILPAYDHYLVWNEAIRDDLLRIYPAIRPEQVVVTGTPQFDFHFRESAHWSREEFCRRAQADPSRPIVLYTTGRINNHPYEERLVEQLADVLLDLAPRPQLLVRVYPKDQTGRFEPLRRGRAEIRFLPAPWEPRFETPALDDLELLTNTLRHCDVGVNIASTISLELFMFGKPTINLAYDPPGASLGELSMARYYDFDHYRPVARSGGMQIARTPEELRVMLLRSLDSPDEWREAQARFLRDMFGDRLDGRCAERVSSALLDLAVGAEAVRDAGRPNR